MSDNQEYQRNVRRMICVADEEPPMCFAANARWLAAELDAHFGYPHVADTYRAAHASAINAWMILETMRVNRRIARDVKPAPIPPPGDLTNQLSAVTRRFMAKRTGL